MLTVITLLFASLALLATIGIFRWKAHDEKILLESRIASEYAICNYPSNAFRDTHSQFETLDGAKSMIIITRGYHEFIRRECEKKQNLTKEEKSRFDISGWVLERLNRDEKKLKDLAKLTHQIRKYFNYPFYLVCTFLVLGLTFSGAQKYLIWPFASHYWIVQASEFLLIALSFLAMGFALLRFYNLFNFSYIKDESHGFDRLPKLKRYFMPKI